MGSLKVGSFDNMLAFVLFLILILLVLGTV